MSDLKVHLDLSQVRVVDRFRYRATIQVLGNSRCFDWPVSEVGVSDQIWFDLCGWVSKAIRELLGEKKFLQICIHKTNGLRGQRLEDSWLEVLSGILMPVLYDEHILRDDEGETLIDDPIQIKSGSMKSSA